MKACFGDTSYFLAMLVPRDVNHQAARRWAAQARTAIVTSEYVVLEVGNFLSPTSTRNLFDGFLRVLRADSRITIVPASSDLMRRGSELYIARTDKSWSLTDCISFEIMREHGITEALTADRHFEQAGFTAIRLVAASSDRPLRARLLEASNTTDPCSNQSFCQR